MGFLNCSARAAGKFYNISDDFFVHSLFQNRPMIDFQIGNDIFIKIAPIAKTRFT